jgi:hypothetical protein
VKSSSPKSEPSLPSRSLPPLLFPQAYGGRVASEGRGGHSQQINEKLFDCPSCRDGSCSNCPDRILALLGRDRVCSCGRSGHEDSITGEPRSNQVEDPFTGDIHGPGATVKAESGEVEFAPRPSENDSR